MKRVSRDILIKALENTIGTQGIPIEAIKGLADYILELFGFEEAISDETLRPSDRDIFYLLEDEGILTTDMDEVPVKHGRKWMIHYWRLRVDVILALASETESDEEEKKYNVYEDDELWERDGKE